MMNVQLPYCDLNKLFSDNNGDVIELIHNRPLEQDDMLFIAVSFLIMGHVKLLKIPAVCCQVQGYDCGETYYSFEPRCLRMVRSNNRSNAKNNYIEYSIGNT